MGRVPEEEHNKLIRENSNLKAEIDALRERIDALQDRCNDLRAQKSDLTVRVEMLAQSKVEIENLQKQKDELFAVLIHDIKNPAGMIKNLVELLFHYNLNANEQQDIISDIFKTTTTIVSLSQEISRVMALETTELKLTISIIDLNDIIFTALKRNKDKADKKHITMKSEIEKFLPEIEADHLMIEEIIENLLSNAVKFTHENGKVLIRVNKESETKIIVEVIDTGQGLSEGDIRNAFVRGAKLSASPTAGESSSGLGLWVVKKLVDGHNGRVMIKSILKKGSNFAFTIPTVHEDRVKSKYNF